MYKLIFTALLVCHYGNAFSSQSTPTIVARSGTTTLHLFGGNKGGDNQSNKAPGMMDQLAMFKKAQEMAQKKKDMDAELGKMTFEGIGADGKVKATFKYVPNNNPMDPNPDYDPQFFEFDDAFYDSASPDELAQAVKEAVKSGIEKTNMAVAEKYAVLQQDLMQALGQAKQ